MNKTNVTEHDLGMIGGMNGSSSVNSGGVPVVDPHSGKLLNPLLNKYNVVDNFRDELLWIKSWKSRIMKFLTERFIYNNLPDGINKYMLERKLIEDGSILIFKNALNDFGVYRFQMLDYDMYGRATKIKINEPKSVLHGKVYNTHKSNFKGVIWYDSIIPNETTWPQYLYTLKAMEKVFYNIYKGITKFNPKVLLNLKGATIMDGNNSKSSGDVFEKILNSENTYFGLTSKDLSLLNSLETEGLVNKIELPDNIETMINRYNFFKNDLSQMIGDKLTGKDKKERLVSSEVDEGQGISSAVEQCAFNLRKIYIDETNKKFSLNISIEYQPDSVNNEDLKGVDTDVMK